MKRTRNIAIFIPHLGCPFRCCFCQQQRISDTLHYPSPAQVKDHIETALSTIPAGTDVEVAFFGGTFTSIPEKMQNDYLECARPYLEKGKVKGIRLSTRPDAIDGERLKELKRRGVTTIELGVQSLDTEVLRLSERGYEPDQVVKACQMIHYAGIRLGIQLMVGLPGDNFRKDLDTTRQVIQLHPDMVRIYPTLVIKGTELEQAFHEGRYQPLTLEEAVDITAAMYMRFRRAHIPVIRMGLHPGEELQRTDTVVAGPFHPAFGELVLQKVALEQARFLIKAYLPTADNHQALILFCPPRELSQLVGPQRSNILALQKEFGLNELAVKSDESLPSGSIGAGNHQGMTAVLTREQYLQSID